MVNNCNFWQAAKDTPFCKQRTPIHTSLRRRVRHYRNYSATAAASNWHSISVATLFPYQSLLGVSTRAHAELRAPICRHQIAICLWKFIVFAITVDSFPTGATPRNEITLFNSLFAYITHAGVFRGEHRNIAGFCLNMWIAFGTHVRFLLVWIG